MKKRYFAYIGDFCTAVQQCAKYGCVVDLGELTKKQYRDVNTINDDSSVIIQSFDTLTLSERLLVHSKRLSYKFHSSTDTGDIIPDIDHRLQPERQADFCTDR